MLTIKAEIKKDGIRNDGTYNVKVRFILNRKVRRLSTSLFAQPSDINRKGELKQNTPLYESVAKTVLFYRERCRRMEIEKNNYSLDTVMRKLQYEEKKEQQIDFIKFSKDWIGRTKIKGVRNYASALNSFMSFLEKDTLNIKELTIHLLKDYIKYLEKKRAIKENTLLSKGKRIPSNRTVSLYLGSLRHLYKEAQSKYNDYDEDLVLLPYSPFDRITIPKQEMTRKRALTVEQIRSIYLLPYKDTGRDCGKTCKYDLAKDCFILSFCLIGMNSVDLYNVTELRDDTLIYNRTKTKDRRLDKARMEVRIPSFLLPIVNKYRDPTGKKVFGFHHYYKDAISFNRAINLGLKEIGDELGIDDLEFYAARHSWATIALNKVGIDKYTVHSSLNHVDGSMRVTDIYIQRDFVLENNANSKVLQYIFGDILTSQLEPLTPNISRSFLLYGTCKFA